MTLIQIVNMNERIKELARQAYMPICREPFDDASQAWNENMEKFAELIVRDLIDSMIKRYGDDDELPIQEIKFFVKEHFGV